MKSVAIIGAGSIARAHASVLSRRRDMRIAAVVDPSLDAAEALAADFGARVFASAEAMLAAGAPDAAHVLTPPPTHAAVSIPLLDAGVDVFVEKPMAATSEDARAMLAAAETSGAALGVNHNFAQHPVVRRASETIESGRLGAPQRLMMRYAAPLRQLAARQFGHWMFNSPTNLLLEQAVHPLSVIEAVMGPIANVSATPGAPRRPDDGIAIATDWMLDLVCAKGTAQLEFTLGASFPSWTLSVLCADGVIDADIFEARVASRRAHAVIAPGDMALRNLHHGAAAFGAAASGLARFAGELLRIAPPADGFSRAMIASINAFHDALMRGEVPRDETGARLVETCERVGRAVLFAGPRPPRTPPADATYDVAVFGGTGFIGRRLVAKLVEEGKRVAVVARNLRNLPTLYHHAQVGLYRGSIADEKIVADVCARAGAIVNLAHGGGGGTREAIVRNMTHGAQTIARAASRVGADRLIHVSSSAALYLGDDAETITSETSPDENAALRADYAYAKIEAEAAVRTAAEIPFVILRPAIVVGAGASPNHSALGAFENDTHCIGWNGGDNALPFVLVDDVASAILAAIDAPTDDINRKALNLVGDVRWSARQYMRELARATGRPLRFHPMSVNRLGADEWLKWGVKKVAGRKGLRIPALRDLRSRGMVARFDVSEEKRLLGWRPCNDENEFRRRAILPHADAQKEQSP